MYLNATVRVKMHAVLKCTLITVYWFSYTHVLWFLLICYREEKKRLRQWGEFLQRQRIVSGPEESWAYTEKGKDTERSW